MRKIVVIPDSFKGTMTSEEICCILTDVIHQEWPSCEVISIPVADGGEGSIDAFLAAVAGQKKFVQVKGPYGEQIESFYGVLGNTAVVEMAAAAGLPLVGGNRCAEKTSTYGVGELIRIAAQEPGVKRVIVGLGGSATNDGGCGAAAALGAHFYDKFGNAFVPVGATLVDIYQIDVSQLCAKLKNIELVTMCDIDNPLCGKQGAAAIFGPQKGASPEMVKVLDQGLAHLAQIIQQDFKKDILNLPGSGAGGGMGGGMVAFFDSQLQMGIETILDVVKFDQLVQNADLILTGEGRIDGQSLRGKVIIGVAHRAKKLEIPVVALVGDIAPGAQAAYEQGVTGIFSINQMAIPYAQAKLRAKEDLRDTAKNLLHYTQLITKAKLK